ncbi:hypothetical protein [Euzebya tangerina]|uniref:hypothetical protein n=1 Tax=Euzebya tangerina TaxID=591198 RepID=UPI000E312766|nr:hypothetical protein [Euzebya tangerina]
MLLWSYLIYVVVAVVLTVWLASTLFRNGTVFLSDVFENRQDMAQAVNRLLVVGFYMLNLGWALLIIRTSEPTTSAEAVELLAVKLGQLLFTLGIIHFANLLVFSWFRRRSQVDSNVPPVTPTYAVPPPTDAPFPPQGASAAPGYR